MYVLVTNRSCFYVLVVLKELILGSLSTFSVISTDFNSVVVRSNGYKTLSNNNEHFYV